MKNGSFFIPREQIYPFFNPQQLDRHAVEVPLAIVML